METNRLLTQIEFTTRWTDLDAYNHINNSIFYDLMTESRCKLLWEVKDQCAYIVSENSCNYKKPVQYPSIVTVEQYLEYSSTVSFDLKYIFKVDSIIVAEGKAKMVCFDLIKNRPVKIPESLKSILK